MARGSFRSVPRARQLVRFDGFQYGNITPTDIDGLIDFRGSVWVLFEVKSAGKDVPRGQRLALERLIETFRRAGQHGIAMIAEQSERDCDKDVYARSCRVREIYTTEAQHWRPPKWPTTAKEMADAYVNYYANFATI